MSHLSVVPEPERPEPRTRAPKGTPTFYVDDAGVWHGWVTLGRKRNGRLDRRHRQGATETEVREKVSALITPGTDTGVAPRVNANRMTLAAWAGAWLTLPTEQRRRHRQPAGSTLARYRTDLACYILPTIGYEVLDDLTEARVREIFTGMAERGLSVAAQACAFRTLRACLNDARRLGWMTTTPLANVSEPSESTTDAPTESRSEWAMPGDVEIPELSLTRRALGTGEVRDTVRTAISDAAWAARWLLAILVGLRQGEALGLQWGRVNWDAGTVTIDRQLRRLVAQHGCGSPRTKSAAEIAAEAAVTAEVAERRARRRARKGLPPEPSPEPKQRQRLHFAWVYPCGRKRPCDCPEKRGVSGLALVKLKTNASRRVIPVPDIVMEALRRRLAAQQADQAAAGDTWVGPPAGHPECLVFSSATGRRTEPRNDQKAWKTLLTEAKVRDARLHDARHTAATIALSAGVNRHVLTGLLGWASPAMAERYGHHIDEAALAAVDTQSAYLDLDGLAAEWDLDGAEIAP